MPTPNEYAIDLSALEVQADKLQRRLNKIDRRISFFSSRYEQLLIAKNADEVTAALNGILCEECQARADGDYDW